MVEISRFSQSSKRLKFTPCPDLPLDILINHVFVELPVRSLAHCRCVCKQWLRALTEPEFTRLHHNRQIQKPHSRKILCGPMQYHNYPGKAYCIKKQEAVSGVFYSLDIESSSDDVVVVRLPGFCGKYYYVSRTLGYSNGMVCTDTRRKGMYKGMYLLFGNPSTGVHTLLPDPITGCLFGGFGYDSSSDDYKFVRIVDGMTHIFSLKSNSWRNIGYSPSGIVVNDTNIGCFLDGSIYWLLESSNRIIRFDLKDELFQELPPLPSRLLSTLFVNFQIDRMPPQAPLPRPINISCSKMSWLVPPPPPINNSFDLPEPRNIPCSKMSMNVVGGSVCITDFCFKSGEVVMWSLFNEGETYSWKKLINVTLPCSWSLDPVCFTEDGKILFFVWKISEELCYIVVDPKTKKIEDYTIPKLSNKLLKEYRFEAHLSGYMETLVSPY